MRGREPPYKQKAREKAETDRQAASVHAGGEYQAKLDQLISSIDGISTRLQQNEKATEHDARLERRLGVWEVSGLWAAAIVGIAAIVVSSFDAHEERNTMNDQVKAMNEQKATMGSHLHNLRTD